MRSQDPARNSSGSSARRGNLVIVSNRLPVSLQVDDGEVEFRRSSGGLAAALGGIAEADPFVWVGWPGCPVPDGMRREVQQQMARDDLVPVFLSEEEEDLYYHSLSNQVLWPLFHYFTEKVDFSARAWDAYVEINNRFAEQILAIAEPGARVWIHDFHLMLVPGLLRQARADLEIGFFLHIPFPSSEIYRLLPAREELLRGVLGADYVGFHTHDYARHFRSTCLRVLGLEGDHESVQVESRRVGVGVHPIGIPVHQFDAAMEDPKTRSELAALKTRYQGKRVILGVERLDYTKGVELKLAAFERLLETREDLRDQCVFLQIIVPSRLSNPDYASLKRDIEETVGRVNGKYGSPGHTPVEYLHRSVPFEHLIALYRIADIGFVAPVRDGMNLVAQEYVHCQSECDGLPDPCRGILVLSEFAGAARVLTRAMMTNPWDTEGMVKTLEQSLDMSHEERRDRMTMMADHVRRLECQGWADKFITRLGHAARLGREFEGESVQLRNEHELAMQKAFQEAEHRVLFLDYDGTLRELVATPEEAQPTDEIYETLEALKACPNTEVHIVSGRHRDDLNQWFAGRSMFLSAEHGFARYDQSGEWKTVEGLDLSFLEPVEDILREVTEEVPGTRIERKPCALAWHYRQTDVDYGAWRARELHSQLEQDLAHLPVDILNGHRVLEIRSHGVNKGGYVGQRASNLPENTFILCIGDDRTDVDMYGALPKDAWRVHVGRRVDEADYSVGTPGRVREVLRNLARSLKG
ncbi:MAG: bifunctional alpha,alpha-trehalose-phosphate synthase (UDP-forming)/trehalose-phosphatase [Planctomycetota bacterium]